MSSYEVLNATPIVANGEVVKTMIDIRKKGPGRAYLMASQEFEGDHRGASKEKQIEMVLEVLHDETTPASEIANSIRELEEGLKDSKEIIESQKEIIKDLTESNETIANAFEELVKDIYKDVEDESDEEPDAEGETEEDNEESEDE